MLERLFRKRMTTPRKLFYSLSLGAFFMTLYTFLRKGNSLAETQDQLHDVFSSENSAKGMIPAIDEFETGTKPIQYFNRTLPDPALLYKKANPLWMSWGPRLKAVRDYFHYIRIPQANCRKLRRMGGEFQCTESGDSNDMDGHKYICMEPVFMLTHNKSDVPECLTLSFGTHTETSFDEAMAHLPCEVHMFDIIDYSPPLAAENPNAHFHQVGIASNRRTNFYSNTNTTAEMYTLRDHLSRLNLTDRLIHVLKVDIENSEWEVFGSIANDPILDAIGQVALEVHALDVVKNLQTSWSKNLPTDKWLQIIQDKYDVLRAIEARGFRRVLYWDNYQRRYPYFDDTGVRYETSGEILYINTNWYDPVFRKRLADDGYKFHDIKQTLK